MSELKNQELQPLDVTEEDWAKLPRWNGDRVYGPIMQLICRERQLTAALNELKAKDTELAAKDARIAALEANFKQASENAATNAKLLDELYPRAQAAEKSLAAVSEVLKEKLTPAMWGDAEWYIATDTDALHTRLRAIVEGK